MKSKLKKMLDPLYISHNAVFITYSKMYFRKYCFHRFSLQPKAPFRISSNVAQYWMNIFIVTVKIFV